MGKLNKVELYSDDFFEIINKIKNTYIQFGEETLIYNFAIQNRWFVTLFYLLTDKALYLYSGPTKEEFIFRISINSISKLGYGCFDSLFNFYILLTDNTVITKCFTETKTPNLLNYGEIEVITNLIQKYKTLNNNDEGYDIKGITSKNEMIDGGAYLKKRFARNKKEIIGVLACNQDILNREANFEFSKNYCIDSLANVSFSRVKFKKNYILEAHSQIYKIEEIGQNVNFIIEAQKDVEKLNMLKSENIKNDSLNNEVIIENEENDVDYIFAFDKKINKQEVLKYCPDHKISAIKYLKDNYGITLKEASRLVESLLNNTFDEEDFLVGEKKKEKEKRDEMKNINETITYIGGHPNVTKDGFVNFEVFDNHIEFEVGLIMKEKGEIEFKNIQSVHFETASEFKSRITLTRIALLGPVGLFLRKHRAQKLYYLTIDCGDYSTIFSDEDSREIKKVYQKIYFNWDDYKKRHKNETDKMKPNNENLEYHNNYDELIQLKNLLDQGIITQDDYDKKKKEILKL